jgi:hypothetical protein
VHDLVTMLDHLYFHKDETRLTSEELTLNAVNKRLELGASELAPYIKGYIYRSTIAKAFLYEETFGDIPSKLRTDIIADPTFDDSNPSTMCDVDLVDFTTDLAQSLAFKTGPNEWTHGVFDMVWSRANNLKEDSSLAKVLDFREEIDNYIRRFAFMKGSKRLGPMKETVDSWLQADIVNSSIVPKSSPYYEVMGYIDIPYSGRVVPPEGAVNYSPPKETIIEDYIPQPEPIDNNRPMDIDDYIVLGTFIGLYAVCVGGFILYLHLAGKSVMYLVIQTLIILGYTFVFYRIARYYTVDMPPEDGKPEDNQNIHQRSPVKGFAEGFYNWLFFL